MGVKKLSDRFAPATLRFRGTSFFYVGTWNNKRYVKLQAHKMKTIGGFKKHRIIKVKSGMYRLYSQEKL